MNQLPPVVVLPAAAVGLVACASEFIIAMRLAGSSAGAPAGAVALLAGAAAPPVLPAPMRVPRKLSVDSMLAGSGAAELSAAELGGAIAVNKVFSIEVRPAALGAEAVAVLPVADVPVDVPADMRGPKTLLNSDVRLAELAAVEPPAVPGASAASVESMSKAPAGVENAAVLAAPGAAPLTPKGVAPR
jgi:hypothetical protein